MARSLVYLAVAALLALLLATAFWAGRFTAAPPTFTAQSEPGAGAEDPLAAAWDDFIRAQQETLQLMLSHDFNGDDQERAEAYRGLLYTLVGAIKAGALQDHEQPRFMAAVDWTSKSGLDNPDNNYFVALVRDDQSYRISGTRGTSRNLIFQLVVGQPGVRGAGSSTNISILDAEDINVEADGSFEIILSAEDPGEGVNWLPSGDGAEALLVRYSHSDWQAERRGELRIERIGGEGESALPLDSATMANKLRDVAVTLYDRTATWISFAEKLWTLMPSNEISKARETQGGLVGQYAAFGSWDLQQGQALVLTTWPSDASYQGIELGNRWFVSLEYTTRTSSLTTDQAWLSKDGAYHFVISRRDPGIHNWLDPEHHQRGLIMLRWQGLKNGLPEGQQPTVQLVDFDRLREVVPAEAFEFTPLLRGQQIRQRRAAAQDRFDG